LSKSYLVTGGENAWGQQLIARIVETGNTVHALFSSPKLVPMSLLGKINLKFCFLDLEHETHIDKSLPRIVDIVYHGHTSDTRGKSNSKVFAGNSFSTMQLLDWAKKVGVKEFILRSSGTVYGGGETAFSETDRPRPLTFATSTKYIAEMLAGFYQRHFSIKILRMFCPYGPGVDYGVIHDILSAIRNDADFELPYLKLTPIYVDDIARIMYRVADVEGSMILNLCGPEVVELWGVAERIGKHLGKPVRSRGEPKQSLIGNNQKLVDLLQHSFSTSFGEGMEKMLAGNAGL